MDLPTPTDVTCLVTADPTLLQGSCPPELLPWGCVGGGVTTGDNTGVPGPAGASSCGP